MAGICCLVPIINICDYNQLYTNMHLRLSFSFCAPKNYVSHFKVRTRLAEFFKHIHPDQMAQAPVPPHTLRPKSKTKTYAHWKTSTPTLMPSTKKKPFRVNCWSSISARRPIIRDASSFPSHFNCPPLMPSRPRWMRVKLESSLMISSMPSMASSESREVFYRARRRKKWLWRLRSAWRLRRKR